MCNLPKYFASLLTFLALSGCSLKSMNLHQVNYVYTIWNPIEKDSILLSFKLDSSFAYSKSDYPVWNDADREFIFAQDSTFLIIEYYNWGSSKCDINEVRNWGVDLENKIKNTYPQRAVSKPALIEKGLFLGSIVESHSNDLSELIFIGCSKAIPAGFNIRATNHIGPVSQEQMINLIGSIVIQKK